MKKFNYYNGFGIAPKNTYISAGTDYYIPNIDSQDKEIVARVEDAFFFDPQNPKKAHSFDCTNQEAQQLKIMFTEVLTNTFDLSKATEILDRHWHNILHLYLALQSFDIEEVRESNGFEFNEFSLCDIYYFVENYLVFDENGTPGICMEYADHLFVNSGIKVALEPTTGGLYVNKSGMGKKGWDVRAQLVDEDYSGYVHLSASMTMATHNKKSRTIYCGDKLVQMMIVEVKHYSLNEVDKDTYDELMKDSNRGELGFGSDDVKH